MAKPQRTKLFQEEEISLTSSTQNYNVLMFREIDRINTLVANVSGDYDKDTVIALDGSIKVLKALLMKSIFNSPDLYNLLVKLDNEKKEIFAKTRLTTSEHRKKFFDLTLQQYDLLLLVYQNYFLIEKVNGSDKD